MVKPYHEDDFWYCVDLFVETFNGPPWNNSWDNQNAERHLRDLIDHNRFVGVTLWHQDVLVGAAFGHEQTWYKGDELCIDELYIAPAYQRQGYGKALMDAMRSYATESELCAVMLHTDRRHPAYAFFEKNGFAENEHMALMRLETNKC